jgi:hypothetical protein
MMQPLPEKEDATLVNLKRAERAVGLLLSAIVLFLLIVRATHAGALWRDECDSLQLALMPRFAEVVENLHYTSFPILFPVTLRSYTLLFGTSDNALRFFGLAVGVAFICAAWFHSRTIKDNAPLLLLTLIGLNTTFLTVGGWIRGYGLGCVLIILAFALTERLLLRASAGNLAAVLVAYLVGMHCLFFNGALVPGIVIGAVAVFVFRGQIRWAFCLLTGALLCGLSYVPYIVTLLSSTSEWAVVLLTPASFKTLLFHLFRSFGHPMSIMPAVWIGLLLLAVLGTLWRVAAIWKRKPAPEWDLLLFALLAALTSIAGYYSYLRFLKNEPLARYFLALLCLVAVAIDLIVATLSRSYWARLGRIIFVAVAAIALPFASWSEIKDRQSNIDLVAKKLELEAAPSDLIVVNPWSTGVSFNWYYHGRTPWITVPLLSEHRIHRYDLLKERMDAFFPLDDLEREIRSTMTSGHRVWLVGGTRVPPPEKFPMTLTPGPDPKFGWDISAYRKAWSEQLGAFLRRHVAKVNVITRGDKSVSELENIHLWLLETWRD